VSRDLTVAAVAAPRPASLEPEQLGFHTRGPVRWLGPLLLATTGARVILAEQFGAYLDKRELQSALAPPRLDHTGSTEFWFDYTADVGDGFDATYSVAYLLAQPSLDLAGRVLPRGQILVLGGDQVYPTPSAPAYENRFRGPYRAAFPRTRPGESAPVMYALPGNHDWYDGLTAFLRVFARKNGHIGAWRTAQTRSYFGLRLPHGWWLFAIDAQPECYLDDPQLEYFRALVRDELAPGDRVIICTPNPAWVQAHERAEVYDTLDYFVRTVIDQEGQPEPRKPISVPLMLSGDQHHYARYVGPRRQLITSGGGGAFLTATHQLPRRISVPPRRPITRTTSRSDGYDLVRTYPSRPESRSLGVGVFTRLPWRNWGFVLCLGFVHALLLISLAGTRDGIPTLTGATMMVVVMGMALFLAAGLTAGTRRARHYVAGTLHGLAHLTLGYAGLRVWRHLPMQHWHRPLPTLVALLGYGPVAAIVAGELVAFYLFLASHFRVNVNELFSGQSLGRFKGFLRIHIGADGTLTVYPVGLDRTCSRWRARPDDPPWAPWIAPATPLHPQLIEPPVVIASARENAEPQAAAPV
jgi:hypothetical protein